MVAFGGTIEKLRADARALVALAKFELLLVSARRDAMRIKVAVTARCLDWRREAPCSRAYNPAQPRVPAGNPDGGEWTRVLDGSFEIDEGATAATTERIEVAADGHHFVPRAVFGKENLQPETRRVFENEKTGRLLSGRQYFDQDHRDYNDAVRERFNQFLSERGIRADQMSPSQARDFSNSIRHSSEPRIRDFNYRLYQREIWFRIRYFRLRD
jgi:hypothetical protein